MRVITHHALLSVVIAFLLGGGIVFLATQFSKVQITSTGEIRQVTNREGFTNQLLECAELPASISIGDRKYLQSDIEKKISEGRTRGTLIDAAVYYRDLNNGPWFGVNQDKPFYPGSLLKVPLAISYYKRADTERDILARQFQYDKAGEDYERGQPFGQGQALQDGAVYSIADLLTLMLTQSSNEAAVALAQLADTEQIITTYEDLGIPPPLPGRDALMDVHTFGSFFRILYNATYLDREASEQMLALMAQSTFKEGIVAGLPEGTVVSHKFGVRELPNNIKQLHDCGIVYSSQHPYILCIMTQGHDWQELADVIADISKLIYNAVESKGA